MLSFNNIENEHWQLTDINFYETKTSGLLWNPSSDKFQFSFNNIDISGKITKRNILSSVSQILDPLGVLQPVTLIPNIIIQGLWRLKLGWDKPVPEDMIEQSNNFRNNLHTIESVEIPRQVIRKPNRTIHLHGFSDASVRTYGFANKTNNDSTTGTLCDSTFSTVARSYLSHTAS